MKIQFFVVFALFAGVLYGANAAVNVKNDTQAAYAAEMAEANSITEDEARVIAILEKDIRLLDAEIKKCESSKKGWTAATVIGSTGVVATGIAAIVQGVQISNKKDELKKVKADTKKLKEQNAALSGTGTK